MIPGEVVPRAGEITLNAGREAVTLAVANTGDRPVQVGSHYHFLETNAALAFDRARPAVGGSTFRPAPRSASSPARPARCTIYVIDVAARDKIPRKGGPGITRSDLLVINKTDLAPLVGADLGVMARDARRMRGERPFVFTNIRSGEGVATVADFITMMGGLAAPAP